jgi:xylulokinase
MGFLLGLDVGSQSVKACILNDAGERVAVASSPCALSVPAASWAEQDPRDWQQALIAATRSACAQAGISAADEVTIGLACQVDGIVAADADHQPLRPAIIWMDRRAAVQSATLAERVGEQRLRSLTGLNPDSSHSGPKAMWLRDNEPDSYRAARWLGSVGAYMNGWLTGNVVHDHANASSSLLYDLEQRGWSEELLDAAGLDPRQLPEIGVAHHPIGTLRQQIARQLGLGAGTVVVCGTGDDHGGTLGAGAVGPGALVDVTGTAEPVTAPSPRLVIDPEGLVETHAHASDGVILLENPGFVSGGSTAWLAQISGRTQGQLLTAAARAAAGSDGVRFLPALSGSMAPRWNDAMRGSFTGLSLGTGVEQLARAVIEGCCYALRDIVDRLESLGVDASELRVVGGGARSDLWLQIKADVTGRPVRRILGDCATSTGAAVLAGVGAGTFTDLDEAVERAVELDPEPIAPQPQNVETYQQLYRHYRSLYDTIEQWTSSTDRAGGTS